MSTSPSVDENRTAAEPVAEPIVESTAAEQIFVRAAYDDPLGAPLLEDLEREYDRRYGDVHKEPAVTEILRYPPDAFAPPTGAFILLLEGETPISGGAFMRYDDTTAEFKRIWTDADRRGHGLAGRVLVELETEAVRLGYSRIYLTTGPRQPEAVRLYLRNGYTPLFDLSLTSEEIGIHPFEKDLGTAPH
ncbi:N-acetyltransferase [Brevibacterium sediminis]|uniref:N-acetyltransferase n=1 Tax=Brevibacterium sediminis TaxID=1857024 RepID=A0ABQ1M5E4_9MICO|nr:GNAT family N-acetyltransferase [Brevibacterium sediminis]GGC34639.1 N-acetyltransferase [Brevibacterium sediminis]